MWLRSIGIVLISASVGQVIGRFYAKGGVILGLIIFAGLICMIIGDWLERNKLIKGLEEIKRLLKRKE